MSAVIAGQYEASAALIAEGARLDLRNSRNQTAADLAAEFPGPEFLMQAFQGRDEACRRVLALALASAYVEV